MRRRMRQAASVIAVVAVCSGSAVGVAATSGPTRSRTTVAAPTAFAASLTADSVTPFDTATHAAGAPIPLGGQPTGGLITSDGKLLFVGNSGNTVLVIDTATDTVTSQIPCIGGGPAAISPPNPNVIGGPVVYLGCGGKIVPYLLRSGQTTAPWNVSGGLFALSRDGLTAYISNSSGIVPYSVEFGTSGPPITLPSNNYAVRFSPDGKTLWTENPSPSIAPFDIATGVLGTPIPVSGDARWLAISPDSKTLYVLSYVNATVTPIDVASSTAGTPIPVPKHPNGLTITPDGKTLFVLLAAGSKIIPIDLQTDAVGTPFSVVAHAFGLTTEPDQAPVAILNVTAAAHGSATAFDASASHVQFGTIVRYRWVFGDGRAATTTTPSTNHTYVNAGTFRASVTETDSAGTSTTLVFDGQMAVHNGGPSARASQMVVIP